MKRFAALIVSCSFVTASLGQQALTAGTLQYSVSTLIEHPTMGSGTPKPKKLEILFTKDSLRVNALYGKSMFQTITACISPQSTQYATNGNKFYVLQLPRPLWHGSYFCAFSASYLAPRLIKSSFKQTWSVGLSSTF